MADHFTVAVIGLGYFSQFHLRSWNAIPNANLVAVADRAQDRVDQAAKTYGVSGFIDIDQLLETTNPDIVDLVSPPDTHAEIIQLALQANRTIVCQKPFCRNLSEASSVAASAKQAGATLLVHENFRFQPWYRELKRFLDADGLGKVYQCRFTLRPGDGRGRQAYLARQPSFQTMQKFLVRETGVHFFDVFRWLFGDVVSIYADLKKLNGIIAGEDAGLILLEHDTGVRSTLDANRLCDHATDNPRKTMGEMLVEGEKGSVRLDGFGSLFFRPFGEQSETRIEIEAAVDDQSFGGGCVEALNRHVIDGLSGGVLENQAMDYLKIVELEAAAYQSSNEARKVMMS